MAQLIVSVFSLASLASLVYSVYSIFDGFFDPMLGLVLAIVALFVFLWCLAAYQRESLSAIEIIFLLIAVLVIGSTTLAYSDVEPFATAKDQLLSELQTLGIPINPAANTTTNVERKSPIEAIKKMFTSSPATIESIGLADKSIIVSISPTEAVWADKQYKVDLVENRKIRGTANVSWSQPEINVKRIKVVHFPLSDTEYDSYLGQNVSQIFKVDVHE